MKLALNTTSIDKLNIGLILISLLIAIYLPFQLFLFSYAFLGPLHYLTEINWLNEKNFFIKNPKKWIIPLIIGSLIIGIYGMLRLSSLSIPSDISVLIDSIEKQYSTIILAVFLFSISLVFSRKLEHLAVGFFLACIISYALNHAIPQYIILIGIFVPTIIHVYLFTGLFMLYGARKAKSKAGFWACLILLFVPLIISFLDIELSEYTISEQTVVNFLLSNMGGVNQKLAQLFALAPNEKFVLLSEIGIKIQIFIAFAYTYHYLNWFSKTSIIGWKKSLSNRKSILIIVIWLFAVVLYMTDYKLGFMSLFFLSFLHVFLEFPLNILTIKELFK